MLKLQRQIVIERETMDGDDLEPYIVGPFWSKRRAMDELNSDGGEVYYLLTQEAKDEGYIATDCYLERV